jgi:hypothetical protein
MRRQKHYLKSRFISIVYLYPLEITILALNIKHFIQSNIVNIKFEIFYILIAAIRRF